MVLFKRVRQLFVRVISLTVFVCCPSLLHAQVRKDTIELLQQKAKEYYDVMYVAKKFNQGMVLWDSLLIKKLVTEYRKRKICDVSGQKVISYLKQDFEKYYTELEKFELISFRGDSIIRRGEQDSAIIFATLSVGFERKTATRKGGGRCPLQFVSRDHGKNWLIFNDALIDDVFEQNDEGYLSDVTESRKNWLYRGKKEFFQLYLHENGNHLIFDKRAFLDTAKTKKFASLNGMIINSAKAIVHDSVCILFCSMENEINSSQWATGIFRISKKTHLAEWQSTIASTNFHCGYIVNDILYAGNAQYFYAFNLSDGTAKWTTNYRTLKEPSVFSRLFKIFDFPSYIRLHIDDTKLPQNSGELMGSREVVILIDKATGSVVSCVDRQ